MADSKKPKAPEELKEHPGDQRPSQPLAQIAETSNEAREEAEDDQSRDHGASRP